MMFDAESAFVEVLTTDAQHGAGEASMSLARQLETVILPHAHSPTGYHGIAGRPREQPCVSLFERLALSSPWRLHNYIHDQDLTPGMRARAAEAAGMIRDGRAVLSMLVPLLGTAPPIVQEAAIYGLEPHLTPEVRLRLHALANASDTSEGVRAAAQEAIEQE